MIAVILRLRPSGSAVSSIVSGATQAATTGSMFITTVTAIDADAGTSTFTPSWVAGTTFTPISDVQRSLGGGLVMRKITYITGGNGGSATALTVNCSNTMDRIQAILDEVTGLTLSGTNGINNVIQIVEGAGVAGTPQTSTMAAFADAVNNACYASASFYFAANPSVSTPKSGFTEVRDNQVGTSGIYSEYIVGQDTTPNVTIADNYDWLITGIELQAVITNNTFNDSASPAQVATVTGTLSFISTDTGNEQGTQTVVATATQTSGGGGGTSGGFAKFFKRFRIHRE